MTICTPWRVGMCLNQLLNQINAAAPGRSTASDGSIGDDAHQSQGACGSQHNSCCIKYLGVWIVRARDFTHDPVHGADMAVIAEALRISRDFRIRYVIFNRRYFSPNTNWQWMPYTGDNPHDKHMHVSTWDDAARFDNTALWSIGVEDMTPDQAAQLAQVHAIVRADRWQWVTDRAGFIAAGGDPAIWDYAGGMGANDEATLLAGLATALTKVGEQLTLLTQKVDAIVGGDVNQATVVAALESDEGQAALVKANETSEDS